MGNYLSLFCSYEPFVKYFVVGHGRQSLDGFLKIFLANLFLFLKELIAYVKKSTYLKHCPIFKPIFLLQCVRGVVNAREETCLPNFKWMGRPYMGNFLCYCITHYFTYHWDRIQEKVNSGDLAMKKGCNLTFGFGNILKHPPSHFKAVLGNSFPFTKQLSLAAFGNYKLDVFVGELYAYLSSSFPLLHK